MVQQLFADAAQAQLSANVTTSPTVGTPEVWSISSPVNLPSPATGQQFYANVQPPGGDTNPEIVIVTGRTSTTMNVLRGEGSNGVVKTHTAGDIAKLIVAAPQLQPIFTGTLASINYTSGAATVTIPAGTVSAVLPGDASFNPSLAVGATVAVINIAGVYTILGAEYVRAKPSGHMHQSTPQTYPNAANTGVNGMTYDWLTGGMANSGSNGLTVPIAGNYRVTAAAGQSIGGIGEGVEPLITVNNAIVRIGNGGSAGGFVGSGVVADMVQLNASDIVGLSVWQNQGSNVSIANGTATYLTLEWVSWV